MKWEFFFIPGTSGLSQEILSRNSWNGRGEPAPGEAGGGDVLRVDAQTTTALPTVATWNAEQGKFLHFIRDIE